MRRFLVFALLLVAVLSLFPLYSRFKEQAAPVPPGVLLGGVDLTTEKEPASIRAHLEPILRRPVGVRFRERLLLLRPEEVGFTADVEQMIADAGQYLSGWAMVDIAVREALGLPQQLRNVPVRYTVDEAQLRAWLARVAADLDYPPLGARARPPRTPRTVETAPLPAELANNEAAAVTPTSIPAAQPTPAARNPDEEWSWVPGTPGYRVDTAASLPRLLAGLTDTGERQVELALIETLPSPPNMADLETALARYVLEFPGFAGIYVQDLSRGDEANINGDVAFSGMSTLKVALAAALVNRLSDGVAANNPAAQQIGQLMDYALGESNNFAANQALVWLGDDDLDTGAQRFTTFLRTLGIENTYMQAGYDAAQRVALPTAANQRTPTTGPDANLQTTPQDLGRMLAAIFACSQGGGLLLERFPASIKPHECAAILFYMTHDEFRDLLWGGLPDPAGTWILHKHGFSALQHSDVALIWGPTGPYVLSVFLQRDGWLEWALSNSTMGEISRLTWSFFEFQRSQGIPAGGEPPIFGPPPGYLPVATYAPSAANPQGR